VDLELGHHAQDGIEVIDVQGEIDMYTAPQLRQLLIDLVSRGSYQLVVDLDKVGFLDSAGLGVLVGGLKRVRAHDGWLDLACTQQRIPRIFRITGLTEVFGIYETVDQAIDLQHAEHARRDQPRSLATCFWPSGMPAASRDGRDAGRALLMVLAPRGEVAARDLGLGVAGAQHPLAGGQGLLVQRDGRPGLAGLALEEVTSAAGWEGAKALAADRVRPFRPGPGCSQRPGGRRRA